MKADNRMGSGKPTTDELRLAWIEALESGEFKQTRGALKDEYGYCCLGVGCEVYHRMTGRLRWSGGGVACQFFGGEAGEMPVNVLHAYDPDGDLIDQGELATLNDTGAQFHQIAARLRKEFNLPAPDPGATKDAG